MRAEIYKGIEFIRISNLPEDQKAQILQTFDKSRIIKILRDKELLGDCIQFKDYTAWKSEFFKAQPVPEVANKVQVKDLKLAFK